MRFYSRLVGLLGMLVAVPVLGGIPDSPQQVQPLSENLPVARTNLPHTSPEFSP